MLEDAPKLLRNRVERVAHLPCELFADEVCVAEVVAPGGLCSSVSAVFEVVHFVFVGVAIGFFLQQMLSR